MKVLTVFGTRPEAIKMAPLVHALGKILFEAKVCVTAQQASGDLLDQVLKLFPLYLTTIQHNARDRQGLDRKITCRILEGLNLFLPSSNQMSCWFTATTTTLKPARGRFYQRIPVGHCRGWFTHGRSHSPWPEEANRLLTGIWRCITFSNRNFPANYCVKTLRIAGIFTMGNTKSLMHRYGCDFSDEQRHAASRTGGKLPVYRSR